MRSFQHAIDIKFFKNFYCYSVTVVCDIKKFNEMFYTLFFALSLGDLVCILHISIS